MVSKLSPVNIRIGADLWALWEKAIPLNRARYSFGDKARVNEYAALLNSKPGGFSAIGALGNFIADLAKTDAPIESAIRTTPEERQRFTELSAAMERDCIARLQSRQLFGLGFSTPRHPDDPPRIIRPEMLIMGRINFGRDSAAGDGLKFEAIRVIPAETVNQSLPTPNRPGRPSKRELINAAYEACRDEGFIDFTKPQKVAVEAVQARIKSMYPAKYNSGQGFGFEAVRGCIAPDFGNRAKNRKL